MPRGFSPYGVQVGAFNVFPSLAIEPSVTSNVYANNDRKESDVFVSIRPELSARSTWSRNALEVYARGEVDQFYHHTGENVGQGTVGANGRLDVVGLSYITAGVSYARLTDPRTSPESPVEISEPLQFDQGRADLEGVYESGRVRVTARGDFTSLDFRDAQRFTGGLYNTGDRDRLIEEGLLRAEYAAQPNTSVYVAFSGNRRDFRLAPQAGRLDRDSSGYGLFVGSSFDVTRLIRGDVRVGYIDQAFKAGGVQDISGLGLRGELQYFPTQIVTVTARAQRTVEDSGIPGTAGFLETGGSVKADYELRRYIMLSAGGSFFRDEYRGLARNDDRADAMLMATYLSKSGWNLKAQYRFERQSSVGSQRGVDFDDHRAIVSLTFAI